MKTCLLIDFGSTYTKLTAVDLDSEIVLGTSKSKTTVTTNMMEGFHQAQQDLLQSLKKESVTWDYQLACSSAKGGFKMVAVGLSKTLTAEAAKRVALGAGTRILKVFSYGLKDNDIEEIKQLNPDIILVSGGTNGGNKIGLINDISQLATLEMPIPIVVAGNEEAYDEVEGILKQSSLPYYLTENVMPQINVLNPIPTREILRRIFMEKIVEAKGMSHVEKEIGDILMPTPTAVLQAANLLATGTDKNKGIDDLIVVDIGGATTDLHSVGEGKPIDSTIRTEGLQEPFLKRTVEGDLGMRYSALSLLEAVSPERFLNFVPELTIEDVSQKCTFRMNHPDMVAINDEDILFDEVMGKLAIETSFNRHAGSYRREPTPTRVLYYQSGKDLGQFKHVVATGGILINSTNPTRMLESCLRTTNDAFLKPISPTFYLDKTYILSAMGLLADIFPDKALRMLKKYLIPLN